MLDAISQLNGLSQLSSQRIWIARPSPSDFGCEQILPVDWGPSTAGGRTGSNYQILPGDRVFVAEDKWVKATSVIGKITGPFERVAGILGLTNSTIRGYQTMGRAYNQSRSGF